MKRFIKLVAVQMDIEPLQNEYNVQKALHFMKKAIEKHKAIDLFVLPEDFITGPIPRHTKTHCLTNDSKEVNTFIDFAKKYKTHIVLGSFIKIIEGKFYNTTLVINDFGEIILEHHKTKISMGEKYYMTPGKEVSVVKTKIGTIGILNCWELADPIIARMLVRKGADILCSPSFWTTKDLPKSIKRLNINFDVDFINNTVATLAFQFACAVIYANVAGEAKVQLSTKQFICGGAGQSQICVPVLGRVEHMPNLNEEGFLFYRYDRNLARLAEKITKVREEILLKDN